MVWKYWLPTGTCQTTCGLAVLACSSPTHARYRLKFGYVALDGSHQCVNDELSAPCCSHHAASWSSTSLNTRSHVLPYGLLAMPAELRNAAVMSASPVALTLDRRSLAMSTPLPQADAWMASTALGAYESRSFSSSNLNPCTVFGRPAASANPELATLALNVDAMPPAARCSR